jgi:hypothetical protein
MDICLQKDGECSLHEEEESLLVEGERLHRGRGDYVGKFCRQIQIMLMQIPALNFYLDPHGL